MSNYVTPWTAAHQASLFMGFSRQEHWSELPCPPPGDLPNPGIKPVSFSSPALTGRFYTTSTTWEVLYEAYFLSAISMNRNRTSCELKNSFTNSYYKHLFSIKFYSVLSTFSGFYYLHLRTLQYCLHQ